MSALLDQDAAEIIKAANEIKEKRRRMLEDKNFQFMRHMSDDDVKQQPPRRRGLIKKVRALAQKEFKGYEESIDSDPVVKSWCRARLWRVVYIKDLTCDLEDCYDSKYNWKVKLE